MPMKLAIRNKICSKTGIRTSMFVQTGALYAPTTHLSPKYSRRAIINVQCEGQRQEDQSPTTHLKTIATVATLLATMAAVPSKSEAAGWHPRRHMKRMKVEQAPVTQQPQKQVVIQEQQPQTQSPQQTNWFDAKQAYKNLKKAVKGESAYSVGISGRPDPKSYYNDRSGSPQSSGFGWIAVIIASAGIAYLAFGDKLRWFQGGRRVEGGRYVRDRSLGGRTVFVPDGPKKGPRPLWTDDEDAYGSSSSSSSESGSFTIPSDVARAAAAGAAIAVDDYVSPRSGASFASSSSTVLPEWWDPPSFKNVYCPASRKESIQKQLKQIMREMEDQKLLRGMDYPVSSLITVRTLCQEGGGLQVKASAENTRDAIYRAAVRAAVAAASEPGGAKLGGFEPSRFLTGLAHDLQVPDRRAITLVHSEIAATCRSAIIDAEAGYRAGKESDIIAGLIRIVGVLSALPVPPGSPELELVARSIRDSTSLEFRRSTFLLAGSANVSIAPLIAELLGFDPNAVMPQLLMQIEAAKNAVATKPSDDV